MATRHSHPYRIAVLAESASELRALRPLINLSEQIDCFHAPNVEAVTAEAQTVLVVVGDPPGAAITAATELRQRAPGRTLIGVGKNLAVERIVALARGGCAHVVDLALGSEPLTSVILDGFHAWRSAVKSEPHRVARTPDSLERLVGVSTPWREALARIALAQRRQGLTVLISGETGTGKGVVARAIHGRHDVPEHPFVDINCSALPETLLEAELFGHERGAFTDAQRRRRGIFELAHGGTLFLDEIGAMPLHVQAKLLKVVEDRTFRRLGGEQPISVSCRVVAGTNVDLAELVASGRFREDLYYRVKVFTIELPPLRARPGDAEVLAEHFLAEVRERYGLEVTGIAPAALRSLAAYRWPGNTRELQHAIERAAIVAEHGRIELTHLDPAISGGGQVAAPKARESDGAATHRVAAAGATIEIPPEGLSLAALERRAVVATLRMVGGNRSRAARLLGISRTRLLRRIAELEQERQRRTDSRSPGGGAGVWEQDPDEGEDAGHQAPGCEE
ncbi:MAG: sigma 54-interacting transcriptional regulator [Candidatus Schekmanbacteria bacterium]|nr:sigma 54-interacting transcriptional regulator [Candidatus Schekmanbacteria bacterium]